jgi:hypothetical protein
LSLSRSVSKIFEIVFALLDASKEIGVEVNSEKTKYMFMSRHQSAGQSNCIRVANKSFVALGGVVVSVLATGPKVAGSNPAEDDGF